MLVTGGFSVSVLVLSCLLVMIWFWCFAASEHGGGLGPIGRKFASLKCRLFKMLLLVTSEQTNSTASIIFCER